MSYQDKTRDDLHPQSSMNLGGSNTKYPYNHVWLFADGTEVHVDTTPGSERMRVAHRTGTYTEINPDGRRVDMVVNRHNHYIKGGHAITVDGNANYKVGGSTRSSVHGDNHTEVKGKHTEAVGGDKSSIIGGDHVSATSGDSVHGVQGKAIHKYGGGLQLKFDGTKSDQNTVNAISDVTANVQFGKDFNMYVKGTTTITCDTKIVLKCGESTIQMSPSQICIDSPTVSISKQTYIGQDGMCGKDGCLILTICGPAKQAYATV